MAGAIRRTMAGARVATILVAAVLVASGAPINQAAADDWEACAKESGDTAITACTRVIKSGNYTGRVLALAYSNRGVEWKGKGQLDRAIADYSEAIRINPKYAVAYNNRGFSYDNKGDYERAIADFTEAVRHNPKFAAAYVNRGNTYAAKKNYERAIADFRAALSINPYLQDAQDNLAALGVRPWTD